MADEDDPISDGRQAVPDEWLVAAAREDPRAFAQLYQRHYDRVFRHCVHRLFDRSAAEDVTASAFLQVVRGLRRFHGNGRDFRGWLFRITDNAVNDHLRRSWRYRRLLDGLARRAQAGGADATRDPSSADRAGSARRSADLHDERLETVRRAMPRLRPEYQRIIALRFFDGLATAEIAELLCTSPATVRSQLSRALAAVREAMADRGLLKAREREP